MMRPKRAFRTLACLLPLLLLVCRATERFGFGQEHAEAVLSRLPSDVAELLARPRYQHARWGILAVDLASDQVLAQHNSNELFAPASVTKLFTVAALWSRIGPDHRFRTTVYIHGELDSEGTLHGDLILYPQGDLTLGGRTLPDGTIEVTRSDHTYASGTSRTELTRTDPLQGLRRLAAVLVSAGVRRVAGDVLVDDRYFEPAQSTGSGPRKVTPVMLNDNLIDITVEPTKPGSLATVKYRPQVSGFCLDNQVRTVPGDRATRVELRVLGPLRIQVRGSIAQGRRPVTLVYEVPDPASFARTAFIDCLRAAGIDVPASPLDRNKPQRLPSVAERDRCQVLAELISPPLAEEAKLVLKVSHNLHASALPILLAVHEGARDLASGLRIEGNVLRDLGVPVDQISLGSGAGGSRVDLVTPEATVALLKAFYRREDFDRFRSCLPVLGVDGTLHDMIEPDSPAVGKVFAKTGTYYLFNPLLGRHMLTAKALAGYVETRSGRLVAFAIFVNNVDLRDLSTSGIGRDLAKIAESFHLAY